MVTQKIRFKWISSVAHVSWFFPRSNACRYRRVGGKGPLSNMNAIPHICLWLSKETDQEEKKRASSYGLGGHTLIYIQKCQS